MTDESIPLFKRCYKCKCFLPYTSFYKNRSCPDGLDSRCKECDRLYRQSTKALNRARSERYRKSHPERVKASRKAHQEKYPQKARERARRDYQQDPEKYRAKNREKRAKNPELYRLSWKKTYQKYRDEITEKSRIRRRGKPEQAKAHSNKRRAIKLNLPANFTPHDWERCLEYFDYRCAVCGRPKGLWHTIAADHWIPLNSLQPIGTVPTNIVPLCHGLDGCNNHKKDAMPRQWLERTYGKQQASRILKRIERYFQWVMDQTGEQE